jgi:peptide/nickel transport system permease protein
MPMIKLAKQFNMENITVFISIFIIFTLIILVFFGDLITPHSPTHSIVQDRLKPPFWQEGGSLKYPLGTDSVGRCLLSRIIAGTKYSLGVSVISILISGLIGVLIGMVSGFYGGLVDGVIMRMVDFIVAFPIIVLGLLVAMSFGSSVVTLISVMVIVQWARFARQVRGEVLSIKETDFVAQARVAGCSSSRIIFRHLFPNVTNTVLVLATLQVAWAILVEASLSFLGAGLPPPIPEWGLMVADGMEYITRAWWVSLIPGMAIMMSVLAFNIMGDWIRDRLDPKLRQI